MINLKKSLSFSNTAAIFSPLIIDLFCKNYQSFFLFLSITKIVQLLLNFFNNKFIKEKIEGKKPPILFNYLKNASNIAITLQSISKLNLNELICKLTFITILLNYKFRMFYPTRLLNSIYFIIVILL
uniref:ORF15 n=1 Tax=Lactococcus lactis TaxID=1358 RepID=Q0GU28_9LACT|nr:ORF15 [Lactococcus lactis]